MPEDGQYNWNMLHVLMGQILFVVVDSMYLSVFNMMYHNRTYSTEKLVVPLN